MEMEPAFSADTAHGGLRRGSEYGYKFRGDLTMGKLISGAANNSAAVAEDLGGQPAAPGIGQ
jgi:hypothetical protein